MEQGPRSQEEFAHKNKYAAQIDPLPESDWPTMSKVAEEYPTLCGEEQTWILEALISEAHRKKVEDANNQGV